MISLETANRIKLLHKERRYTGAQIAKKCDVSRGTVWNVVTGRWKPRIVDRFDEGADAGWKEMGRCKFCGCLVWLPCTGCKQRRDEEIRRIVMQATSPGRRGAG